MTEFLGSMMIFLGLSGLALVVAYSINAGCKEIANAIRDGRHNP